MNRSDDIERMDRINFLLTEVSLECLGNRFFDIYGDHHDGLLKLVSADSLQEKCTNADRDTELWQELDLDNYSFGPRKRNAVLVQHKAVAAHSPRKRRASLSNKGDIDENDPESLLEPMQKAPASAPKEYTPPAKINRRRATMNVSQLLKQRRESPLFGPENWKLKGLSPLEMKEKIRNDIKSRFIQMHAVSRMKEMQFLEDDPNANINAFFEAEERELFLQCNSLMPFIQFLQTDPETKMVLRDMTAPFIELQQEF